jgi:hypothetical protein
MPSIRPRLLALAPPPASSSPGSACSPTALRPRAPSLRSSRPGVFVVEVPRPSRLAGGPWRASLRRLERVRTSASTAHPTPHELAADLRRGGCPARRSFHRVHRESLGAGRGAAATAIGDRRFRERPPAPGPRDLPSSALVGGDGRGREYATRVFDAFAKGVDPARSRDSGIRRSSFLRQRRRRRAQGRAWLHRPFRPMSRRR